MFYGLIKRPELRWVNTLNPLRNYIASGHCPIYRIWVNYLDYGADVYVEQCGNHTSDLYESRAFDPSLYAASFRTKLLLLDGGTERR